MRASTLPAILALAALPALAQEAALPPETVTLPNPFVEQLSGPIMVVAEGLEDAFFIELAERDVADLFFSLPPPDDLTLEGADVAVLVHDDWESAVEFWQAGGLTPMVEATREAAAADTLRWFSGLTAPDGSDILVFQFLDADAEDTAIDPRCMARLVVEEVYNGEEFSTYNLRACSAALSE